MAKGRKDKGQKAEKSQKVDQGGGPLQAAATRYEAGDLVGARREARQVLAGNPGDAERAQAQALIARTRPPLWAWPYVAGAAVVLALMLALAIARG